MIACPICATTLSVGCSRCSSCTVNVKWRDSQPVAAGWRGGDPVAAGQALRRVKASRLEPADAEFVEPPSPVPPVPPVVQPCGTESSYRRHLRRHEQACTECLAAHREHKKAQKERARAA